MTAVRYDSDAGKVCSAVLRTSCSLPPHLSSTRTYTRVAAMDSTHSPSHPNPVVLIPLALFVHAIAFPFSCCLHLPSFKPISNMARKSTAQKGKAVSRSAKAGLQFPVGRIARCAFKFVTGPGQFPCLRVHLSKE